MSVAMIPVVKKARHTFFLHENIYIKREPQGQHYLYCIVEVERRQINTTVL
jgi:hypothetical protein